MLIRRTGSEMGGGGEEQGGEVEVGKAPWKVYSRKKGSYAGDELHTQ